ncbi:MAG: 16S rRNA (guanine(527)-N(7))-methyltransferase RsmG [Chitinophagales bacterium]
MKTILKYFSEFTDQQLQQLEALEHLYKEWNSRINVISRKDIDGLYEKHVLHSLSIAAVFDFDDGTEIIDIGTGGGFPGIPLAIFFPQVKFHLVDSIAKKLKVVDAIAKEIGLKNITTQNIRAEEIKNRKSASPGGGFDFAVSRAVAPLKDLWKWSKPLLRNKGQGTSYKKPVTSNQQPGLICLKGGDLAKEISESGTRPRIKEIFEIFPEEFFREKYILYVPL